MAFYTPRLEQAGNLTTEEIAFIQALAIEAGFDATAVALLSDIGGFIYDYVPAEAVNGSNTVFTIPAASQVIVYADGLRVKGAGIDYTFSATTTITFISGRQPFSAISIDYLPL